LIVSRLFYSLPLVDELILQIKYTNKSCYCVNATVSELNLSRRSFSRWQVESVVLIPCKLLIFLPPFEILLYNVPAGNTIVATKSLYLFTTSVAHRYLIAETFHVLYLPAPSESDVAHGNGISE